MQTISRRYAAERELLAWQQFRATKLGMLHYYFLWLKTIFTRLPGIVDLWSGIIGAILTITSQYISNNSSLAQYFPWIPVWVLAAVFVIRLILAPYWIWKEQKKNILEQNKEKISCLLAIHEEGANLIAEGAYEDFNLFKTSSKRVEAWAEKSITKMHALGFSYNEIAAIGFEEAANFLTRKSILLNITRLISTHQSKEA